MAVQLSLELDTHPVNEELEYKIRVAKIRLRLAKSALKCDLRDLNELGYIRGLSRRNRELYDEWIAQQYKRVAEVEELIRKLESMKEKTTNNT